nr:MAG TPA: hypothetical protein [Caudoviricetes sp.]
MSSTTLDTLVLSSEVQSPNQFKKSLEYVLAFSIKAYCLFFVRSSSF